MRKDKDLKKSRWKEFFRPNLKKIVLTIVLTAILFFFEALQYFPYLWSSHFFITGRDTVIVPFTSLIVSLLAYLIEILLVYCAICIIYLIAKESFKNVKK